MAFSTCPGVTTRRRMSFRKPSFVSPTMALTERTCSLPFCASVYSITPFIPSATDSVLVNTTGVSISPSSLTGVLPANLPKPLPTANPAGTLSWYRFPPCGSTTVTPVLISLPSCKVTCPTRTPVTSVIALNGPGARTPGVIPRSRARGLSFWLMVCCAKASTDQVRISSTISNEVIAVVRGVGIMICISQGEQF